ncbi:glycerol-3-phosphate 1-O-acyltransferase PlsY [[Clostridium] polysaccharolyticum]|uniref:Glycerol-3-phosphate acyltransferase n=1 Tax=[Clostridium] polysaccharolyticum TaxID=29364 RepID=A0A1I0FHY2_9FIRM|nr:glycerol-3-phosphate 1-O-acyltransferase PlsY [[Clostridium] polysaccharolyticum]SET57609.1 glycerol-3-phosphate acyltransferase PlsY [[Clostridium] polysaccharolyticum]
MILKLIVSIVVGYLFGCFSTGYFVGKHNHINIKEEGSGNSGATNALRTMGIKAGIATFAGDLLKAFIPVLAVRYGLFRDADMGYLYALYIGLGVVLGHNFPFWMHFQGGKGIAVTSAVIVSLADWRITVIGLILFIAIVAATKYVSLGSLMVAWLLTVNTVLFWRTSEYFIHMLILSLCFMVLAYVRHGQNIKRLLSGTESKLGSKKK